MSCSFGYIKSNDSLIPIVGSFSKTISNIIRNELALQGLTLELLSAKETIDDQMVGHLNRVQKGICQLLVSLETMEDAYNMKQLVPQCTAIVASIDSFLDKYAKRG
jgi:hypothetical protein